MALATNLGYPRIGRNRQLKRATEGYWSGKIDRQTLQSTAKSLRLDNIRIQHELGVNVIPSNDFSYYDQVLDTVTMTGAVPDRYGSSESIDLDTYFAMARGSVAQDIPAMEMTKWFNTNYHYIVPEFTRGMNFRLADRKPVSDFEDARAAGFVTKPVLIGPLTFLLLGKCRDESMDRLEFLDGLLDVYRQVLCELSHAGAEWVQLDEPAFVMDRSTAELNALSEAYAFLAAASPNLKVILQTYFDTVGDSYDTLCRLPVAAIGLDFVHDRGLNRQLVMQRGFPNDKTLVAGVIDGRNIWANNLEQTLEGIQQLPVGSDRLIVSPSSSLMFVPIDVEMEEGLGPELKAWLAFADQKLSEVRHLTNVLNGKPLSGAFADRGALLSKRQSSSLINREHVREELSTVRESHFERSAPFEQRRKLQQDRLSLPPYPTTSIGSFPQTAEVRRQRRKAEAGEITEEAYRDFLQAEIAHVIHFQESIGLDVLVHGESERSDMVEYFAEQMDGFAFTRHGWVQSYGSRCVRPPIIYGDVSRSSPMTVEWFRYAQSLTDKPVKGMLTGPVTIISWSFVRDDQPRAQTCLQVALALRGEVLDLEAAGAAVIQIDEPALREAMPLRRSQWAEYLDWAIQSFRLASSPVAPQTQIHSHMCYSDFNSIVDSIQDMDADVVSIENSRSDLELLDVFQRVRYRNNIGPGVYDIHSPRVPSTEEMVSNLEAASRVLSPEQMWVNPDCGLKTRRWEDVEPALRNMVAAARVLREQSTIPV